MSFKLVTDKYFDTKVTECLNKLKSENYFQYLLFENAYYEIIDELRREFFGE